MSETVFVTSWHDGMTREHWSSWKSSTFLNSVSKNLWKQKQINFLVHLQAEIGESSLMTSWHDVMTWRHNVRASHEWKINIIYGLSDLKNHENKKRINFLAHLQTEIGKSDFVTSWHDIRTSQHHTNEKLITFLNSVTQKTMETEKESIF